MVRKSVLRSRLLEAALRLFVTQGFRGTSLQDIASEVGCSKASLGYHFANKEAILTELLDPVVEAMDELHARLDGLPGDQVVAAAVEGFVDVALDFRGEVRLMLADTQDVARNLRDRRILDLHERLREAFAGRSTRPQDQLRAWTALGGIVMATVAGPELPRAETRAVLVSSALRALADPLRL